MKNVRFILAVCTLVAGLPLVRGDSAEPDKLRELMQRKLQASQKVLEGIALNDFDKISKSAEDLLLISKATDWKVVRTPAYELYSNEFRRNVDNLVRMAREKNLDGAVLSYLDLTLNCVKCHKYVREIRMTRLD
jgi:hypothetical protein